MSAIPDGNGVFGFLDELDQACTDILGHGTAISDYRGGAAVHHWS